MRKRIIESSDSFDSFDPSKFKSEEDMVDYFTSMVDKVEKCEFGYLGYSIYTENDLIFFFDKEYHEILEWGCENVTDELLSRRTNIDTGFVSKIVSGENSHKHDPVLPIEFNMIKGKTPLVILHTSNVFKGMGDKTIILRQGMDLGKSIYQILYPVFAWLKLCKNLYEFNRLDVDTIKDLFSEAFDDAEDYAICTNNTIPVKSYEIAISTKTKKDGGFIDIDDDVMHLLSDISNIKSHLSEYNVSISFNTQKPNRDRFPEKNATFYQSQAIVIKILPNTSK